MFRLSVFTLEHAVYLTECVQIVSVYLGTCSLFDRVCSDCQCSPWNMSSSESLYCHNGEGSYFSVLGFGTVVW